MFEGRYLMRTIILVYYKNHDNNSGEIINNNNDNNNYNNYDNGRKTHLQRSSVRDVMKIL